jgi:hypothetical protein
MRSHNYFGWGYIRPAQNSSRRANKKTNCIAVSISPGIAYAAARKAAVQQNQMLVGIHVVAAILPPGAASFHPSKPQRLAMV